MNPPIIKLSQSEKYSFKESLTRDLALLEHIQCIGVAKTIHDDLRRIVDTLEKHLLLEGQS